VEPWLTKALELLGLSTPFMYAYAVYWIAMHFDKRGISAKSKKAISSWLQPKEYDKAAVGDAILEIFDTIYSRPLLRWRAFQRSAIITTAVTMILVYETWDASYTTKDYVEVEFIILSGFFTNILSDYASLFVVRALLVIAKSKPVIALLTGAICGMLIVFLFIGLNGVGYGLMFLYANVNLLTIIRPLGLNVAPLAVHLWLPLFALSVGLLRMLNYFRLAVGKTQAFLKKGNEHPLEAIGYVAAAIVFCITVLSRLIFAS